MSLVAIVLIVVAIVVAFIALAFLLDLPIVTSRIGSGAVRSQMKNIVSSQRDGSANNRPGQRQTNIYDVASESQVKKTLDSRLTLTKKLKYGQWKIPPAGFYGMQVVLSLIAFFLSSITFGPVIQVATLLFTGPILMSYFLTRSVEKRFKAFDKDYPQFLLSLVGLIKTGMQTMPALEAAAQGLEENSLVREEIVLMMERLRFGVSEDKSIGAFGEDIFHQEIELFVQALLLSRRVGGNLSDTLDRLAKQVRRRQFFRQSAVNAVGLQRGSIYFIVMVLVGLELYLYLTFPQAVTGAIADPVGWQIWQGALIFIALGMYWVRQVTKIRV